MHAQSTNIASPRLRPPTHPSDRAAELIHDLLAHSPAPAGLGGLAIKRGGGALDAAGGSGSGSGGVVGDGGMQMRCVGFTRAMQIKVPVLVGTIGNSKIESYTTS